MGSLLVNQDCRTALPGNPNVGSREANRALLLPARQRLQEEVQGFLLQMRSGGEVRLGRNPAAQDLLPFFSTYGWTAVKLRYCSAILDTTSHQVVRRRIRAAIKKVVNHIYREQRSARGSLKRRGVWPEVVSLACDLSGLGYWETAFGEYDRTTFRRASRVQLRASLLSKSAELEEEFFKRQNLIGRSPESNSQIGNDGHVEFVRPFPKRAAWLRHELEERGWGTTQFLNHNGPNEATTRRMLGGLSVRPATLRTVADALRVDLSVIPNC